jgi:hypothetical protein
MIVLVMDSLVASPNSATGSLSALFEELEGEEWALAASEIYNQLKPLLQTGAGLIRQVRARAEEERQVTIAAERKKFLDPDFVGDLSNLDPQIDDLVTAIYEANSECQVGIYYDFVPRLGELRDEIALAGPVNAVLDFVLDPRNAGTAASYRLNMIISRLVNESAGQSNKSNAGSAGEFMGEAVMNAAGLVKGRDFRTQYKSQKGSDTDIVIPMVEDRRDQDVEMFIAIQLSTNDRARLASSELKSGAQTYLLTGNGLTASKKNLGAIGNNILENYSQDNIRLVCYGPEIDREKARLRQMLDRRFDERLERRLGYISSHTFSFRDFARRIRERYASKTMVAGRDAGPPEEFRLI